MPEPSMLQVVLMGLITVFIAPDLPDHHHCDPGQDHGCGHREQDRLRQPRRRLLPRLQAAPAAAPAPQPGNQQVVAAIAAAIAEDMGEDVDHIKILSIRRV